MFRRLIPAFAALAVVLPAQAADEEPAPLPLDELAAKTEQLVRNQDFEKAAPLLMEQLERMAAGERAANGLIAAVNNRDLQMLRYRFQMCSYEEGGPLDLFLNGLDKRERALASGEAGVKTLREWIMLCHGVGREYRAIKWIERVKDREDARETLMAVQGWALPLLEEFERLDLAPYFYESPLEYARTIHISLTSEEAVHKAFNIDAIFREQNMRDSFDLYQKRERKRQTDAVLGSYVTSLESGETRMADEIAVLYVQLLEPADGYADLLDATLDLTLAFPKHRAWVAAMGDDPRARALSDRLEGQLMLFMR